MKTFIRFLVYLAMLFMLSCSSMKHRGRDYKGDKGIHAYNKERHFTVLVYFGFTNHFTTKE